MQEFRIYLCLCLIFYLPHLKVAKKIKFTSFFLLTILTIKLIKYLFLAAWQHLNQQSVYLYPVYLCVKSSEFDADPRATQSGHVFDRN